MVVVKTFLGSFRITTLSLPISAIALPGEMSRNRPHLTLATGDCGVLITREGGNQLVRSHRSADSVWGAERNTFSFDVQSVRPAAHCESACIHVRFPVRTLNCSINPVFGCRTELAGIVDHIRNSCDRYPCNFCNGLYCHFDRPFCFGVRWVTSEPPMGLIRGVHVRTTETLPLLRDKTGCPRRGDVSRRDSS